MSSFAIGGQSSGDFKETASRVQLLNIVTRNAVGVLTPDSFTQANPPVVTTQKSATLSNISKLGVLGGSIAFTRYDYGNGFHGGPVKVSAAYDAKIKPLGIYLNDSLGNAFENTPGVASNRGPYACGSGTTAGLSIYETKTQISSPGTAVVYAAGDAVYASVNGLVTNVLADAYEYNVSGQNSLPFVTLIGIVKVAPDANSSLLVIDLRV
jgi:hypothetical protein